jgi:hypothetical protein
MSRTNAYVTLLEASLLFEKSGSFLRRIIDKGGKSSPILLFEGTVGENVHDKTLDCCYGPDYHPITLAF